MKKLIVLVALLTATLHVSVNACTNFIVTKGASTDGSCLVSYAADSHTLYGELYHWAAGNHREGSNMDVVEWDTGKKLGKITQVAQTYNVVGNMNEHQVAIAETTYGGLKELGTPNGIMDYGSLIYIALQRSKNAREAIVVISNLLDEYGYASSGESFSIIDPNEAWIMELIGKGEEMKGKKGKTVKGWTKGAVWVARRIPDGYISGHANQARITTFPLADGEKSITNKHLDKIHLGTVETVYSHDVISFARLKGFFSKEADDKTFSFSDTYAPLDFGAARFCEARVWAGFLRCNPEQMKQYEDYARGENLNNRMPLWIKPAQKVSARDVMMMMRDHYEGTSLDMTKDLGAGPFGNPYRWRPMTWDIDGKDYIHERATATQQTGFSFVAQARGWLPDPVGGILWFGVDDAAFSCYVPMYASMTKIPEEFEVGNGSMVEYSPTAAFWTFTKVSNYGYTRYSDMIKHVREKQDKWELGCMEEIAEMDVKLAEQYKTDPKGVIKKVTKYSNKVAEDVCAEWNDLFVYLLVKYHDGNVKKEKNGKFETNGNKNPQAVYPENPRYSDEWYRMIVDDCGDNIKAQ